MKCNQRDWATEQPGTTYQNSLHHDIELNNKQYGFCPKSYKETRINLYINAFKF